MSVLHLNKKNAVQKHKLYSVIIIFAPTTHFAKMLYELRNNCLKNLKQMKHTKQIW